MKGGISKLRNDLREVPNRDRRDSALLSSDDEPVVTFAVSNETKTMVANLKVSLRD